MFQTGTSPNTTSYRATIRSIIATEGFSGLWRGNFVSCFRAFPSKAILFATNDIYKGLLSRVSISQKHEAEAEQNTWDVSHDLSYSPPAWISFLGGSLAGLTATVFTYPLDLVRTRLASTLFSEQAARNETSKSMTKTVMNIVRFEGFLGLFRGISPSLLGAIPYEGVKFLSFDIYKRTLRELFPHFTDGASDVTIKVAAGALAGATAGIILYPNDTIRKNMQMEGLSSRLAKKPDLSSNRNKQDVKLNPGFLKNMRMIQTTRRLYREGGFPRFYKGLTPYIIRVIPNSAIQFGVYETLKSWVEG